MTKIAIFGASGHGKVVAEIALLNHFDQVDFYDDAYPSVITNGRWDVVGDTQALLHSILNYTAVIVAIGDNKIRLEKQALFEAAGGNICVLIHPSAVISASANIALGTVVMANAVVSSFVAIGKGCIINTAATIDHDCILDDGVHISPGSNLAGTVRVGTASWIGIGAAVIQNISIGSNVIVGACSAVIDNISNDVTVVGVPARPLIHS